MTGLVPFEQDILTALIVVLGAVTVVLSVVIAWLIWFAPSKDKQFAHAISWQLVGEAAIGAGTLVFAIAAHVGWLEGWGIGLQSGIRLVMFLATAATTIHLYRVIRRRGNA